MRFMSWESCTRQGLTAATAANMDAHSHVPKTIAISNHVLRQHTVPTNGYDQQINIISL